MKNSSVFILIKSLTMSEKRYFKIFSERHTIGSVNKYTLIFDLIENAGVEDDQTINSALTAAGFNADFLSADKNYLYRLLLRALNDFHHSKTYNLEIKEALISIEILFHKGLYAQCVKLINKTEALADECENFQLMIDVLMWKKKCIGYTRGLTKAAEINKNINRYIRLLSNLKRITDLYYESNILQANNEKDSRLSVIKNFKSILNQPELLAEKNALSFSAKTFFHLVYSNYYYTMDDKARELEHLQRLVDLIKRSKTYAIENPLDYVSVYNRLLSIKKYFPSSSFFDDIKVLNQFSKQVVFKNEVVAQRAFIHCNTHELEYYLINNDFNRALAKTKEFEKEIFKAELDIEPYHMIYYYYLHAVTLVFAGRFRDALKFVNRLLNDFSFEARPQIYMKVQVINVIIHYELGNHSLVLSLSKQILKKDTQHSILIPFEEKLLSALIKIARTEHLTFKTEASILKALLVDDDGGEKTIASPGYSLASNYFKWIRAKTQRKTVLVSG